MQTLLSYMEIKRFSYFYVYISTFRRSGSESGGRCLWLTDNVPLTPLTHAHEQEYLFHFDKLVISCAKPDLLRMRKRFFPAYVRIAVEEMIPVPVPARPV